MLEKAGMRGRDGVVVEGVGECGGGQDPGAGGWRGGERDVDHLCDGRAHHHKM